MRLPPPQFDREYHGKWYHIVIYVLCVFVSVAGLVTLIWGGL